MVGCKRDEQEAVKSFKSRISDDQLEIYKGSPKPLKMFVIYFRFLCVRAHFQPLLYCFYCVIFLVYLCANG